MKIRKKILSVLMAAVLTVPLAGCSLQGVQVAAGLKNEKFDYIVNDKADKIIIENVRDNSFKFIINDSQAINDIYKILSSGRECDTKSTLDSDYIFEVRNSDDEVIKKYSYVVGSDSRKVGNFYDDENIFYMSKDLENTIMQNLSYTRKSISFDDVYFQSIMKVLEAKKDSLIGKKVGVNYLDDKECLKYIFSNDIEHFKQEINEKIDCTVDVLKRDETTKQDNESDFDIVLTVKNRGYDSETYKTLITVEDKETNEFEKYYIIAKYSSKKWNIQVSEPNTMPEGW